MSYCGQYRNDIFEIYKRISLRVYCIEIMLISYIPRVCLYCVSYLKQTTQNTDITQRNLMSSWASAINMIRRALDREISLNSIS